jgi:uncharacterized protein DUF4832/GDSL-like lipase/acylhydrolase family protein/glycosyl hydrolase family 42 (putative beta-galactosidase)
LKIRTKMIIGILQGILLTSVVSADTAKEAWKKLVAPRQRKSPQFAFIQDNPELPNVLIYGDSISIGYTQPVREALKGKANVYRLYCNGGDSASFIPKMTQMHTAMRDPNTKGRWSFEWDVIHFNVGLHDLKYVLNGKLNKKSGKQVHSTEEYENNLRGMISFLLELAPQARLIFATTTPVPEGEPGRVAGDARKYNEVALKVLKDYPQIAVNDLYAFTKTRHSEWWTRPGNVHFTPEGSKALGNKVAHAILLAWIDPLSSAKVIDMRPHWDDQIPLANPHKGWYHHYLDNGLAKYLIQDDRELLDFPGMDHLYLRLAWSYLEPKEGQYHWEVVDRIIKKWMAKGFGIAFRITCRETGTKPIEQQFATPKWVVDAGAKGGYYRKGKRLGPEGPWEPLFDDPIYLEKLDNFLKAFAARYDGKPWLRYLDIGSIGDWGEGHTSSGSHTKYDFAQRKVHIDMHLKHLKKTKLVVTDDFVYEIPDVQERKRMHSYVVANGITYRDDSILVDWYLQTRYKTSTVRSPEYFEAVWRKHPTILELQHYGMAKRIGNWQGAPGSTIAKKGDGKTGADIFREALEILHATYIGYHGYAREWLVDNPELTKELLNRCGYWYFLHSVKVPDRLVPGRACNLQLAWENRGVAPAYHPYTLKVRLVGPAIYDFEVDAANMGWLPGTTDELHQKTYRLQLPSSMKAGEYQLKLKMVCPATGRDVLLALNRDLLDEQQYYWIGTTDVIIREH